MVREDVEEISDEEAEWSDDLDTGAHSDFEVELADSASWADFDTETITVFSCSQWCDRTAGLQTFSCPTETLYSRVAEGKAPGPNSPLLETQLGGMVGAPVDEKWVEGVEAVSRTVQAELGQCGEGGVQGGVQGQLVEVALLAVDFRKAMAQPRPTHKVRHIKSGLKLVIELLQCGQQMRQVSCLLGWTNPISKLS